MMKFSRNIFYVLCSELLFTILPLLILIMIKCYLNDFEKILYNTEWAMIAIILFGQSIVKFCSGISNSQHKFRWQLVALIISILIIFGLIPSITLLTINLLSSEMSVISYSLQIVMCLLGIITFFIIGTLGQIFLDEK